MMEIGDVFGLKILVTTLAWLLYVTTMSSKPGNNL